MVNFDQIKRKESEMLQAFFKWGLCLLSAFSSPGIVQKALPAPPYTIALQARGPGRLRLRQAQSVYTTRKEEVLYLSFPPNSSIEIEAVSDSSSHIESLYFDQKPILEAKKQVNWSKRFALKSSLSIQANFSSSSFQSSISSLPDPIFSSTSTLSNSSLQGPSLQRKASSHFQNTSFHQKQDLDHEFNDSKENESFASSSQDSSNKPKESLDSLILDENKKQEDLTTSNSSSHSIEGSSSNLKENIQEPKNQEIPSKDSNLSLDLDHNDDLLILTPSEKPKEADAKSSDSGDGDNDDGEGNNDGHYQEVDEGKDSTGTRKDEENDHSNENDSDEVEGDHDYDQSHNDPKEEGELDLQSKKEQEEPNQQDTDLDSNGEFLGYTISDLKTWIQNMPSVSINELFGLFKTSLEEVQSDYAAGYSANWIYLRMAIAQCLNLLDQVSQEGYLDQSVFDENPSLLSHSPQAILLQKPVARANMRKARAAVATSNETVSVVSAMLYQNIPIFGNYISNYIWILSNNQHAFCASYLKAPPKKDAAASNIKEVDSAALRKTLYYGFSGPENALGDWNHEQQIIITNDLVSLAYSNTCISQGELDGKMWRNGLKAIWDRIQALPDPQNYKAYVAEFPGTGLNHKNQVVEFQPLAFGRYEETPEPDNPEVPNPPEPEIKNPALQVLKTTSDEIISNAGQQNYSLVGAKYEIRKGSSYASGKYVATLTIGKDLSSEVLEVESAGTYWAKEIEAPKGYALDGTAHRIEVDAASHRQAPVRILVYDSPQYFPVDLLLKKVEDQSKIPISNAIFELRYYAVDPKNPSAIQSATPIGTWQVKTDDKGEVRLDREHIYLASYDFPRPQEDSSKVVFPIGVLTLQEVQAPLGYTLNDTLYTIPLNITANQSTQTSFNVYQAPTIPNRPAKIFLKKENESHMGLKGAEFSVQDPQGNVQVIALNDQGNGEVEFNQSGTWTIWESKAPTGYQINSTKATFQVTSSSITSSCPESDAAITFYQNTLTIQDMGDCYGLKIRKKSPTNKPLAGAIFELYTVPAINNLNERTKVSQQTTDENGLATFGNLVPGKKYVLVETKAPNGYVLPEKDGVKPEYFFFGQKSPNGTTTGNFESGYGLVLQPLNPLNGSTGVGYISKTPNQYGFSWEKEGDLVHIVFDCVNEPLEEAELPHTGSASTCIALALGSLLVLKGLKKNKNTSF